MKKEPIVFIRCAFDESGSPLQLASVHSQTVLTAAFVDVTPTRCSASSPQPTTDCKPGTLGNQQEALQSQRNRATIGVIWKYSQFYLTVDNWRSWNCRNCHLDLPLRRSSVINDVACSNHQQFAMSHRADNICELWCETTRESNRMFWEPNPNKTIYRKPRRSLP